MELANKETTIYTSPDPFDIFCYTPSIAATQTGRLIVSFDLGGEGVRNLDGLKSARAKGTKFGQGKLFRSDDNGRSWSFIRNFPFWHARLFTLGNELYLIGHSGDVCIMKSTDNGETWSDVHFLTTGEKWHSSACNVIQSEGYLYLAMEQRCRLNEIEGWDVAGLSPTLFRANAGDDLCLASSWSRSGKFIYKEVLGRTGFEFFGIPFYSTGTTKPRYIKPGLKNAPMGWLETNVVQFASEDHVWHDPAGNTFHLLLRAHTGGTNYACMIKVVRREDGKMIPSFEKAPGGKSIAYLPFPGGHLKFFIFHDDQTRLFWLISNQATDSMRKADYSVRIKRYGLPNNERHRLQLHFSKNCVDWCFAGMVCCPADERFSRNYPSAVIKGEDLHIVCRSADENALNPQYNNLITHHVVENFRRLIY